MPDSARSIALARSLAKRMLHTFPRNRRKSQIAKSRWQGVEPQATAMQQDSGGGVQAFLDMPSPEKLRGDVSIAGRALTDTCLNDQVRGEHMEQALVYQLSLDAQQALLAERGLGDACASVEASCEVKPRAGCEVEPRAGGIDQAGLEPQRDEKISNFGSIEHSPSEALDELANRIAELERQVQHDSISQSDARNRLLNVDNRDELNRDGGMVPLIASMGLLDDTGAGLPTATDAELCGDGEAESLTADLGGHCGSNSTKRAQRRRWSGRLRGFSSWSTRSSGHVCRQAEEGIAKSSLLEASPTSGPLPAIPVSDALERLNQRVAELERSSDAETQYADDPAVADTLRALARRVMELEHRQTMKVSVPALPAPIPMPGGFVLPPFNTPMFPAYFDELYKTPIDAAAVGYTASLAPTGREAARSRSNLQKWADPHLGAVAVEGTEARAPRVPRAPHGVPAVQNYATWVGDRAT